MLCRQHTCGPERTFKVQALSTYPCFPCILLRLPKLYQPGIHGYLVFILISATHEHSLWPNKGMRVFLLFLNLFVFILCVCLNVSALGACLFLYRARRGCQIPGTGVIQGCKPQVSVLNWVWVLYKSISPAQGAWPWGCLPACSILNFTHPQLQAKKPVALLIVTLIDNVPIGWAHLRSNSKPAGFYNLPCLVTT